MVHPVIVDLPAEPLWRRWWWMQRAMPKILKNGKFDLLFTVTEIGTLHPPCPHIVMCRNLNIFAPLGSLNGHRLLKQLRYRLFREPLAYLTLLRADRIVFVSRAFLRQVTRQLHLNSSKTCVIYHGVNPIFFTRSKEYLIHYGADPAHVYIAPLTTDVDFFSTQTANLRNMKALLKEEIGIQSPLVLLYVGRLIPEKGVSYLLEAYRRLILAGLKVALVLVGEGPMETRLLKFCSVN